MTKNAASHYGSFGALVGHELVRAVDAKGKYIDAAGELKTWWTPADDTAWSLRIAPLEAQSSAYPYPGLREVKVNGKPTQDKNAPQTRQSVEEGKRVSVRVDYGGL